jgi:conjugative relaxase-like TrwC/TraI family protein
MMQRLMLTLRAAKGSGYYERAEFARDDYYSENGEVRGSWAGGGAESLGLVGHALEGALGELLEGRDPLSGEPLSGTARRRDGNVGFDLVFAAPKSVSVLAAVGGERIRREVLRAHALGVQAGLDYLERHACFVRRGRNGVNLLRGEGFLGAVYLHEMARSGDPHVHAHLVIANRVRGDDGRWSAPDMRPVYAEAKTAGTIADAVMREALTQSLGVEWGPVVKGIAELAAVPQQTRDHFSVRHAEIMEEALARGSTSQASIGAIQRETRDRKRAISRERAVAEWRARAAEHGFGERELARALWRARAVSPGETRQRLTEAARHMLGSQGLTRSDSSFTRREVIQAVAAVYPQGASARTIERLADGFLTRYCVSLERRADEPARVHELPRFTTPGMLMIERGLLTAATEREILPVTARVEVVDRVAAERATLGEDQERALRHLCSGKERVRVMEARAGTGKTFTLAAVREAYERSGTTVVGVAWQGQAAEVLQRDAAIRSQTAAMLLTRIERGEPQVIPGRSVVVVDEASMIPTRTLERLLREAKSRHARVLLVGDRAQLPSIDAGGGFAAIADRLGAVELTENRRQQTPLGREVAAHLAEGRAGEALALLEANGRFSAFEDARDARAALIARWAEDGLASGGRSLILAHDRHDVRELNEMARQLLDESGLLGPTRLRIEGREWAAGDRLVCRRNDYGLDVRNGTLGTVVGVDRARRLLTLRTDDGRQVELPVEYLCHVQHGYALTGHVSQGATVDRTYLLASPERGGAEWAYVAGSRQRLDLHLFVTHGDPERMREDLRRAWERGQGKELALGRTPAPHRQDRPVGRGR